VAEQALQVAEQDVVRGQRSWDTVYTWSRRIAEAQVEAAQDGASKVNAIEAHLNRLKGYEQRAQQEGNTPRLNALELQYYMADAEDWLARTQRNPSGAAMAMGGGPGGMMGFGSGGTMGMKSGFMPSGPQGGMGGETRGGGLGRPTFTRRYTLQDSAGDPANEKILAALEKPIPMHFPDATALQDVLKWIKTASQGKDDEGIPIYLDPVGLAEAEKTPTSPVESIDLEGVPLKTTLRLMLRQLGLAYAVRDGVLIVSHPEADELLEEVEPDVHVPNP
jgi:hypothetical protein